MSWSLGNQFYAERAAWQIHDFWTQVAIAALCDRVLKYSSNDFAVFTWDRL